MAEQKSYIPAGVVWKSGSITVLIAGIMMAIIGGIIYDDNKKKQNNTNAFLRFKDTLYQELAHGPGAVNNQEVQIIARYVQEHQNDFDAVIKQEKLLIDSLNKAQRTTIHIQTPEKLPAGLLLMSNNEQWQKLRDNQEDMALLRNILRKNAEPPQITLLNNLNLSRTFFYLWVVIPQLCAFLVYLIVWEDTQYRNRKRRYRWYQLTWLGYAGLILLMPGAGIVMIPMIICTGIKKYMIRMRQSRQGRHARQEALRQGKALDVSSDAGKILLRKLHQHHAQQRGEPRNAELVNE